MTDAREAFLEAVPAIASLLSKSEKAICKLTPGTWQHSRLTEHIAALKLALLLMKDDRYVPATLATDELIKSIRVIDSIADKTEEVVRRFLPGTPQHSLLHHRLKALRTARDLLARRSERRPP